MTFQVAFCLGVAMHRLEKNQKQIVLDEQLLNLERFTLFATEAEAWPILARRAKLLFRSFCIFTSPWRLQIR